MTPSLTRLPLVLLALLAVSLMASAAEQKPRPLTPEMLVGVASIETTPQEPIRLVGYLGRKSESEGVAGKLLAKALAFSSPRGQDLAVLITLDVCVIPGWLTDKVWEKLAASHPLARERLAICVSHTHTGPMVRDGLPAMFAEDVPADHQQRIDRYTQELIDKLVRVASEAIAARQPSTLSFAQGAAAFGKNRRVIKNSTWTGFGAQENGPVDHDLPMLVVGSPDKPRAVLVSYACHCTTLGGKFNQVHGDWAGAAQRIIEQRHPGAIAMVAIGCGADQNPAERADDLAVVDKHGSAIADEVDRLLKLPLRPVRGVPECRLERIDLPLDKQKLPTRQQLEETARGKFAPAAYRAKRDLQRLDRGEALATHVRNYPVQCFAFSDDLAMVFLGGEVVVDYARRLKAMFDKERLWVNGYANDVPCYIASKRVLAEGGYEAEMSMNYYDKPTRLSMEVEDLIVDTVQKVTPRRFLSAALKADFPEPLSPEQSLAAISVHPQMRVELVAAEPLVVDPVAFDWGPDGRMWVVEMHDYPSGMAGQGRPGGRIKVLEDTDGDGRYDRSRLFMDGIVFPTGIKVWREGVLVTAAPEVFYAEDTDGDDKADVRKVLYSGFGEENQQHRVNGLRWGLDNWLYIGSGSGGGGQVKSAATGQSIEMARRDVRISPDDGRIDAQSGHTQYGRERDDVGNWFGGNNSRPIWHYVLDDHYLRRNSFVAFGSTWNDIAEVPGAGPVYPASRTLERFNNPHSANRFTSACSPVVYRDDVLGEAFKNNWFVCEPVHNLVHREVMEPAGSSFKSRRAPEEKQREFFASTDNWSRPSMVRVGPDGALYVADMYRFVIEHPKWIPQEWQRKLDVREGDTMGRIYRVVPRNRPLRKVPRLDGMNTAQLVAQLDTSSGFIRDLVHQMLIWRGDKAAIEPLQKLASGSARSEARLQAMCVLDGLKALTTGLLDKALSDPHAGVRRHAVRLAEPFMAAAPQLAGRIAGMIGDPDALVRQQVAYSLGEWDDRRAGEALGRLIVRHGSDKPVLLAALSSATRHPDAVMNVALQGNAAAAMDPLLATAIGTGNAPAVELYWNHMASLGGSAKVSALVRLLDAADGQNASMRKVIGDARASELADVFETARRTASDEKSPVNDRLRAILLLGRGLDRRDEDIKLLAGFISANQPLGLQSAAVKQLTRIRHDTVPGVLLERWASASPQVRDTILDALIARPQWLSVLLDAMEKQPELVQALGTTRREQLLRSRTEGVAVRAAKLLGGAATADRQKLVQQYVKDLSGLTGDAARGQTIFTNTCAVCHKISQVGRDIGPDLVALADKPVDQLVLAILDPNSAVEARFVNYVATTRDGQTLMGLIKFETGSSITLVGLSGLDNVILRGDLKSLVSTGRSLMPEGFEAAMKPQDTADLIAYVRRAAGRTAAAK